MKIDSKGNNLVNMWNEYGMYGSRMVVAPKGGGVGSKEKTK